MLHPLLINIVEYFKDKYQELPETPAKLRQELPWIYEQKYGFEPEESTILEIIKSYEKYFGFKKIEFEKKEDEP